MLCWVSCYRFESQNSLQAPSDLVRSVVFVGVPVLWCSRRLLQARRPSSSIVALMTIICFACFVCLCGVGLVLCLPNRQCFVYQEHCSVLLCAQYELAVVQSAVVSKTHELRPCVAEIRMIGCCLVLQ